MSERAKRKRPCQCSGEPPGYTTSCHWGNCTEWRCHDCHGLCFAAGPAWCQCDGYLRWLRYPGMSNPFRRWDPEKAVVVTARAAVKPSLAGRDQRGRHDRRRQ